MLREDGWQRDESAVVERRAPRTRRVAASFAILFGVVALILGAGMLWQVRPLAMTVGQVTFVLRAQLPPEELAQLDVHEAVHRAQYRRIGLLRFLWLYAFDREQRLAWEAQACAAVLCRALENGYPYVDGLEQRNADALRRYAFLSPLSFEEARAHVRRAFHGGRSCPALMASLLEDNEGIVYRIGEGRDDPASYSDP